MTSQSFPNPPLPAASRPLSQAVPVFGNHAPQFPRSVSWRRDCCRRAQKSRRGIGRAPRPARWAVSTWQSIRSNPRSFKCAHQRDEGRLGGVRGCGEHRLAEEGPAEGDAVEAAGKDIPLPDLDGVGVSEVMEGAVGLPHLRRDPGAVLSGAGPPAGGNHLREGPVERDPDEPLFQELPHAPGDAEFIREKDETGVRRPPEDRFAVAVPGEDPLPIGGEQALRREVAADGQQTALFGMVDGGKENRLRESIDRHG